ncbi:MAG: serine hydroxymethyltransferase [candidate division WS1 bacterium]|nr:serine hydroxymethyltransferase [candidate division WS1 bacterium]
MLNHTIAQTDPQLNTILRDELERQRTTLMLIPSENYASRAVMNAMGSIFTNKYAEGYPGARYYNGCENYDLLENLAIERAKDVFHCEHVNVQVHTGSQANMAAYYALLNYGDRILAMSVDHGGHLTHGKKRNFSGQWYDPHFYELDPETYLIDYDQVLDKARQVRPKLIVAGASAYPRIIDFQKFREIADEVGAYLLADIAHIVGLVAAGSHPDPVPYCDVVTSTTHKTLRGPRGAMIMSKQKWAKRIDQGVFPGVQAGPLMQIVAAKAVCFKEAQSFGFREYQRQIVRNCQALARALLEEGFELITGGTDNHLLLVDLHNKDITGREAADLLEAAGLVCNKNLIPNDERSAVETSGIRLGTPALTSRDMREPEMLQIGKWVSEVVHIGREDEAVLQRIRGEVADMCAQFPIYLELEP